MEMSWLAIAGLAYASLVTVKFIIYFQDTRRLVAMMKVMDVHPGIVSRTQFFVAFLAITAIGLWFTAWFEVLRERGNYFTHVSDEHLYRLALKMSKTEV
jgi:hypothetical protein